MVFHGDNTVKLETLIIGSVMTVIIVIVFAFFNLKGFAIEEQQTAMETATEQPPSTSTTEMVTTERAPSVTEDFNQIRSILTVNKVFMAIGTALAGFYIAMLFPIYKF